MAEGQILSNLAPKLGIKSDKVVRKANEYMRMADVRSAYSSLTSLNLSGSCKAVMCLELAAIAHGEHIDKATAQRVAGMKNKKLYSSGLRAMECMLDLQSKVTVPDLTVQFGCPGAKQLTLEALKKYDEQRIDGDSAEYSQVLFNAAAMYAVCRRQKQKVDKTKLVDVAGVNRAMFDRVVAHMDKTVEALLKEQQKNKPKSKKTASFLDEIVKATNEESPSKRRRETDAAQTEEDIEPFDVWRDRILQEAYKALDKEYKPTTAH